MKKLSPVVKSMLLLDTINLVGLALYIGVWRYFALQGNGFWTSCWMATWRLWIVSAVISLACTFPMCKLMARWYNSQA